MIDDVSIGGREQVADWIEITLLARGAKQIGNDELYRLAAEEIGVNEAEVNLAVLEMKRRGNHLRTGYPFEVLSVAVRRRDDGIAQPYSALLLLTPESVARQSVARECTTEMEVLFERITESAVANLWGEDGRALRFGWPSEIGRPQEFSEAILWLARRIGIQEGAGFRPPRRKDGGVDVVGWRPFSDGRGGVPIVLVQCTLQSDIRPKARDVDTRVWASWLSMDFDPITALAVPQSIRTGVLWDELALHGMVLDRIRLAGLVKQETQVAGLETWNESVMRELAPMLRGAES